MTFRDTHIFRTVDKCLEFRSNSLGSTMAAWGLYIAIPVPVTSTRINTKSKIYANQHLLVISYPDHIVELNQSQ